MKMAMLYRTVKLKPADDAVESRPLFHIVIFSPVFDWLRTLELDCITVYSVHKNCVFIWSQIPFTVSLVIRKAD